MASFFGIHFVNGLLAQTGWPRRKSFFNSTAVVDSVILDIIIGQMIDGAASIGACHPKLALQIIATMYRDADWDSIGLFDIIRIDDSRKTWNERSNNNPREIVKPTIFSQIKDKTPATVLNENITHKLFENYFFESLFWGLNNPDKFINYFMKENKRQNERLPLYEKAGLEVNAIPTLEDFLNDGEKIISLYEEKMNRHLSLIPQRLIKDAHSLGIEIND